MIHNYLKTRSKFNNLPVIEIKNSPFKVENGWTAICHRLNREILALNQKKTVIVIETYQGVIHEELISNLKEGLEFTHFILSEDSMLTPEENQKLVFQDVTNDRIFGFMTRLTMDAFFDREKVEMVQSDIELVSEGLIVIYDMEHH